jgi:hypothetical protein
VSLLAGWTAVATLSLLVFGAEYAVFLRLGHGGVDTRAPFLAAALIVAAELAFAAMRPPPGGVDVSLVRAAVLRLALVALGAVAVGELTLVAAGSVRSGLLEEGLGVAAAVVALAIVAALASRVRRAA